jgi:hypothetical protein
MIAFATGRLGGSELGRISHEIIAKPPKTSHAKFAKYAKFCFMDDFANLADFA